jgi:hypothetical protein
MASLQERGLLTSLLKVTHQLRAIQQKYADQTRIQYERQLQIGMSQTLYFLVRGIRAVCLSHNDFIFLHKLETPIL